MKKRMLFTLILTLILPGLLAWAFPAVTPPEEIAFAAPQDETGSRPAALDLAAQAVTVDVYQNMEGGNDGDLLTPDIMNATSYGGWEGVDATWEINGNMWVSTDYVRQFPDTVFVNGTDRSVSSTHTWMFSDKYKLNFVTAHFGSLPHGGTDEPYHEQVTIACYYTPGSTGIVGSEIQHDTIVLGGNETFAVLQTLDATGGPYIQAHSCTAPCWDNTTISPRIKVETGKTYWVNLHHDGPAGEVKVAVFDPDNGWAQVGDTVIADSVPRSDAARSRVKFGRCSDHGNDSFPPETYSYFSHIMIDYTDGTFPLLPDFTDLELHGTPGNKTIRLNWTLNSPQSPASWTLHYDGPQGDQPPTIADIPAPTRAYTLTGLTNDTLYTITLTAAGTSPVLSDTVQVTPEATVTPTPTLDLYATPGDQTARLTWELDSLQSPASWTLHYDGPQGDQTSPIADIPAPTRAYTLTGLTNDTLYTITLTAVDTSLILSDTVQVMPVAMNHFIYLPLVLR